MKLRIRKRRHFRSLFSRDWFTYPHSLRFRYGHVFWRPEGLPCVAYRANGKIMRASMLLKHRFVPRVRR